ncbi:MAG TPA: hypothetical protein VGM51_04165 [Armatimonadota bacterium]
MTSIKTLVTAGLLLAGAAVAFAGTDASVKVLPAATRTGTATLQIVGDLGTNGATQLTGVEVHLKYDTTKVTFGAFTPAAGSDWANQGTSNTGGEFAIILTSGGSAAGPVGTIAVTLTGGASTLTKTVASAVSDQDYNTYYTPADTKVSVFTGALRTGLGAIAGAPSTGPGKVVAVAAGTSLKLLNAADLTDVAGFTAPAVGSVTGRPVFGMVGTQAVLAVGDDAGKLTIVDAGTGASVAALALGAKVSTPAIAADGIYAAVTAATGPASVVKVVSGASNPFATLTGTSILGAPAVFGGYVAVGTDAGLEILRPDGVHQATVGTSTTISPVIANGGLGLSANATDLLPFNAVTGNGSATVAHGAGAVSEAWWDGNSVIFGTSTGKILTVDVTTGVPTLSGTPLTSGSAITAQPISLGGVTYAQDVAGTVVSSSALEVALGSPSAKALAATGRTAGTDSVIAATADGTVGAIAF